MRIAAVLVIVFLVTVQFGFYRAYTRKLTLRWFLAIHVPVVFVYLTRSEAGFSYWFIPFTFATCIAAQIVGSRIGRWWIGREVGAQGAGAQTGQLAQGLPSKG